MYTFFDFNYETAVFEWDDEKARINYNKHGVRFELPQRHFLMKTN